MLVVYSRCTLGAILAFLIQTYIYFTYEKKYENCRTFFFLGRQRYHIDKHQSTHNTQTMKTITRGRKKKEHISGILYKA